MVGPNPNFCGSDKYAVEVGCASAHGLIKTLIFVCVYVRALVQQVCHAL